LVENKIIRALVNGGKATAGPPLGPALGPLGVNVIAIVNKINEVTESYPGMKVPVKILVNPENKEFKVEVGVPTTAALIVKEVGIEKGSAAPNTEKVGDLSMQQIIEISKIKMQSMLAKDLRSATKEVLGSCVSIGVTIEGKDPKKIQKDIDDGNFASLFGQEKKTVTTEN